MLAKHDENYMPPEGPADATNGMHFKPEYTEAQLQGAKDAGMRQATLYRQIGRFLRAIERE